jgi:hypothetical protein
MTVTEIVESLYPGSPLLKEAIVEAVRQKEAVSPALLEMLQSVSDDIAGTVYEGDYNFIASAYLLAQFREKSAFPLLVSLLKVDESTADRLWGDVLTQSCALMLRDTFNGDPGLLREVIENRSYSPWARATALEAYSYLYTDGYITRRELTRYFRRLIRVVYRGNLDEDDSIAVSYVGHAVIDCHLIEMIDDIKELYDKGVIDRFSLGEYDEFLEMVNGYDNTFYNYKNRHITDTIEELETWRWFKQDRKRQVFHTGL